MLEEGIAIRFSDKDINWCRKCYIYLLVNVEVEQRYYVTSMAYMESPVINSKVPLEITVNPFQMNCYYYFVLRVLRDVVFSIKEYTGHSDMYILV